MKELAFKQPAGFAKMLQKKCAKAGVKLVYTPCLPNAPIKGSTRWLNGVPCIQMADTYRNDVFWFTFFHELGHVLLHGKGDVFLELDDIEYTEYQQDKDKEKAADDFSYEVLLPAANEQEIINHGEFTEEAICNYAEMFKIHTGIIVGLLQHRGVVPVGYLDKLKSKLKLSC